MIPLGALRTWFTHLAAEWQVRAALAIGLSTSNAVGIAVVVVLALLVVPLPDVASETAVRVENLVVGGVTIAIAGFIGTAHAWRVLHPVVTMLRPGATPGEAEQRGVLAGPRRLFVFQAFLWAAASVLFLLLNLRHDPLLGVYVFLIVGLAGWSTSGLTYLVAERALRPVARRVLARGIPDRRFVRSVASRSMFAWGLGTGASAVGIVVAGIAVLAQPAQVSTREMALIAVVLGGIVLVVGGMAALFAAQASSEPIRTLRKALVQVQGGDFDVSVPIYDGTEIGLLQAGFNEMVTGLREREAIRDLFGRHVGEEVARAALGRDVQFGGEIREVSVLFVDVIGSTTLAEQRPPDELVALLNRFFEVVIDVVHDEGGWINKFQGDAALAVWGAPVDRDDRHSAALVAARTMGERLAAEVPELPAGIGVSTGRAVAGNVGAAERYEYTVIGDAVNEAARLTTHAKQVPARVLASQALLEGADDDETARWHELEPVQVRGRSTPTRVITPRGR